MRILYVTGLVVFLDQVVKLLVKGFEIPFLDLYVPGMALGASYPLLGDFLRLTFIENPGMAFGLDFGGKLFLTIFSIFASIGIFVYLYRIRQEAFVVRLALALILGGAIGNLIDRVFYGVIFGEGTLFYGKVVDFVDVDFFNLDFLGIHATRFPVFNIADASVSCGVVLLLLFHRKFTEPDRNAVALAPVTTLPDSPPPSPGELANNFERSQDTPS
ncbi:MAG TPA: signal peptidase II [Bacteroidetes bacterium]|nr:signal peptidase II [Bacteroidota bacterium]